MRFLIENCSFRDFDESTLNECESFDCGNSDLNEFFNKDVLNYQIELLGKSYCFTLDTNPKEIVCAFTVSNDSIKMTNLPNSRAKKVRENIPRAKHIKSYPAVLIGRFGVNQKFHGQKSENQSIGQELMNFIKNWFIDSANKTGCRFIVVDSYNDEKPLNFYQRNGFVFLFSSEEQEREYFEIPEERKLNSRLLYFDLILLKSE